MTHKQKISGNKRPRNFRDNIVRDKYFKRAIIAIFKYLKERYKWYQKKQVELLGRKNIIAEMKMSVNWLHRTLESAEETKIVDLKTQQSKLSKVKDTGERDWNKQVLRDEQHSIKRTIMCSLEEKRQEGAGKVFEGIVTEIFPIWWKP